MFLRRGSRYFMISIHAPREGGDYRIGTLNNVVLVFQSTPPARGATIRKMLNNLVKVFQSTPPARGATKSFPEISAQRDYFNPRPPRGGRRG